MTSRPPGLDRSDVEAAGELVIVMDGQTRRVDLCAAHLKEARTILRPWLGVSRPDPVDAGPSQRLEHGSPP